MRWLRRPLPGHEAAPTGSAHPGGQWAEDLAHQHLSAAGLSCLARNYRSRQGECDLIMQHHDTVVFVEVRYRRSRLYGGAVSSIGATKQHRIAACASRYLQENPEAGRKTCRFDVVVIGGSRRQPKLEWIQDAFRVGG
jgi:putative endonuclease